MKGENVFLDYFGICSGVWFSYFILYMFKIFIKIALLVEWWEVWSVLSGSGWKRCFRFFCPPFHISINASDLETQH